ncbi:VOC family protein [Mumia zhuanghuii]|uniref:VOC family protein n=2 Tax=Mumia TaxID=1546255 RepID=A0ABW1QKR1_9ACTN|nr:MULTISPECIES: VOC family protein [Mumia]KAA1424886.1 VOC family protein [Mumia zhuanghuii]
MSSRISHTTIDAHDAYAQSEWWKQVLVGYTDVPGDPNEPGHEECMIVPPADGSAGAAGPVLFIEVPEGKSIKNRIHLDLRPTDRSRDAEVERVLALGATQLGDFRRPDGTGWITLADPEGNEFCILRSDAEVAEQDG